MHPKRQCIIKSTIFVTTKSAYKLSALLLMYKSSINTYIFIFILLGGGKGPTYPFGIMGMTNKADCLQKGENVKLQVCTVTQTGQKMACNVIPQRRAPVECVKDQVKLICLKLHCLYLLLTTASDCDGFLKMVEEILKFSCCFQFGFITYEVGESKKLFFHVKEVQDGIELQMGDEVEFSVVFNQRTGKCSACNVRRVRYEHDCMSLQPYVHNL